MNQEKVKEMLKQLPVSELKAEVLKRKDECDYISNFIFEKFLEALETKMPEKEFISFCDQLYQSL